MTLRFLVLATIIALSAALPVRADPFEDGKIAYGRADYGAALAYWRPLAERGHDGAQLFLGHMYENGNGVPQSYAEALKWYRKSADAGNAGAQTNTGAIYATGQGARQDYAEAIKWYRRAAEQGFAPGQINLASMYANGKGVAKDNVQALKWYSIAAGPAKAGVAANLRDATAKDMTAAQIAEAQRQAAAFMPKKEKP